jgi:hypothetical protein
MSRILILKGVQMKQICRRGSSPYREQNAIRVPENGVNDVTIAMVDEFKWSDRRL